MQPGNDHPPCDLHEEYQHAAIARCTVQTACIKLRFRLRQQAARSIVVKPAQTAGRERDTLAIVEVPVYQQRYVASRGAEAAVDHAPCAELIGEDLQDSPGERIALVHFPE